jgi:hypothetical protein
MDRALLALGLLQMLIIPVLGSVRWQLVLFATKAEDDICQLQ